MINRDRRDAAYEKAVQNAQPEVKSEKDQLREWFRDLDAMNYPKNQEAMQKIIAWARQQLDKE